ncbi:hypothetical protein AAF712_007209 [Marasmius tenuissimus]|uniref:F-box domain-containing protein n=1 Tax=Marasmius tenuissimus TaxID=585030 RepID=A0ABR2ZVW3_9AGAR
MSFVHLPPELWLKISESLPRPDAAQLCLVNHQFLSLIRPLIYQHVSLYQIDRTYNPDQADPWEAIPNPIDATLSLLARDGDLAKRLEELVVHHSSDRSSGIGLSLEQLAGFTGLKKVEWRSHTHEFLSLDELQEMPTSRLEFDQDLVSQKAYTHYYLLPAQHWKHLISAQAVTLLQFNQPYSPSTSLA